MNATAALNRATEALPRRRGLPDPRREALFLLAAAWDVSEIWLRTHGDEVVPPEVEARFDAWVERRAGGEPAEHLVGRVSFWGRRFEVGPSVLIPRPETELVVRTALDAILPRRALVADVGAGSGCLSVTLAAERPDWTIVGIDRSPAALLTARRNGAALGVDVAWVIGDLTTSTTGGFDLVVANLPYLPTAWLPTLGPEIAREPTVALDGGADGLDLVRRLLADLPRILAVDGLAILELAEDQADPVEALARRHGLDPITRRRDVGGCDRVVVVGRSRDATGPIPVRHG